MRFRPCIDIHNGEVKQIVGGTLTDKCAAENYVSEQDAAYYAALYKKHGLYGGHMIMLNKKGSEEYERDKEQVFSALLAFPGGLQVGGGIDHDNAREYTDRGAAAVIVTSAVFHDGIIDHDAIERILKNISREQLIFDLSVRRRDDRYMIVTDRWQKFTQTELTPKLLFSLSEMCGEFLVHAADVEGKKAGIDINVVSVLSESPIPVTYAGGISSMEDIGLIERYGGGRVDFTVGSALDIFGGHLPFDRIADMNV